MKNSDLIGKDDGFDQSPLYINHRSCGELFLVEQDTIEYVSVAYVKFIIKLKKIIVILCNFLVWAVQYFLKRIEKIFEDENMKKPPSKVHNRANFFSVPTANQPKMSPNLKFCSIKITHRATYV